jgi:protein-disulfide isomerase-like protein with CxxC motif
VTGAPGVGKSRLARELLARVERAGRATAWVSGSASTTRVPLGALAHVLPQVAPTGPVALLAQVRSALGRDEPEADLVVALDDAHLLDHTTLTLLGPLVEGGRATLLATVPDMAGAPAPLVDMWRAGRAYVVELGPLDDFAVDTLLHRALGGPVDGAAMLALLDASGGNALFLRELVLGSLTGGRLAEAGGVWRIAGDPLPSGMLRALVQSRVSSLGPDVQALLEDIAVGEPTGLDDLVARHGADRLEAAERAGLVRVATTRRRRDVTLAHGLHGDVLRAELGAMTAGRLARTHAEAAEGRGSRRAGDPWRVALWRLAADGRAPVDVLLQAASLAHAARDLDAVERLARAALAEGDDPVVARLLAEVLYERGEFEEALDVVAAAERLDTDDETRAVLASARATVLGFGLLRLDEAPPCCRRRSVGPDRRVSRTGWQPGVPPPRCGGPARSVPSRRSTPVPSPRTRRSPTGPPGCRCSRWPAAPRTPWTWRRLPIPRARPGPPRSGACWCWPRRGGWTRRTSWRAQRTRPPRGLGCRCRSCGSPTGLAGSSCFGAGRCRPPAGSGSSWPCPGSWGRSCPSHWRQRDC